MYSAGRWVRAAVSVGKAGAAGSVGRVNQPQGVGVCGLQHPGAAIKSPVNGEKRRAGLGCRQDVVRAVALALQCGWDTG